MRTDRLGSHALDASLEQQLVCLERIAGWNQGSSSDAFNSILRSRQLILKIHNLFDLHQEPAVDLREVEDLLDGEAGAQGVADEKDAFGVGHAQFAADDVAREDVAVAIDFRADAPGFAVAAQAAAADLQRAQAFLQAFLERAADGTASAIRR